MSKAADINLWGIHARKTDATDSLFPKKNCIAVDWRIWIGVVARKQPLNIPFMSIGKH
jgi:hypothetical protein